MARIVFTKDTDVTVETKDGEKTMAVTENYKKGEKQTVRIVEYLVSGDVLVEFEDGYTAELPSDCYDAIELDQDDARFPLRW